MYNSKIMLLFLCLHHWNKIVQLVYLSINVFNIFPSLSSALYYLCFSLPFPSFLVPRDILNIFLLSTCKLLYFSLFPSVNIVLLGLTTPLPSKLAQMQFRNLILNYLAFLYYKSKPHHMVITLTQVFCS